MDFRLDDAVAILSRTPATLRRLLEDLPQRWTHANEGPETWSPFDVLGHLIHGERTDWPGRARMILDGESSPFPPFDRFAMFEASRGRTLDELLDTFDELRSDNLRQLEGFELTDEDLDRTGRHPDFGPVTLRQLLATWVAHDLGHLAQISRTMAKQYVDEVGPWYAYLPVLQARKGSE